MSFQYVIIQFELILTWNSYIATLPPKDNSVVIQKLNKKHHRVKTASDAKGKAHPPPNGIDNIFAKHEKAKSQKKFNLNSEYISKKNDGLLITSKVAACCCLNYRYGGFSKV